MTYRFWGLVIVILLISFALRVAGIAFGNLPEAYNTSLHPSLPNQAILHPDEYFYVSIPIAMLAEGRLNPEFFENPSFLIYLNYLSDWLTRVELPDNFEQLGARNYASFPLYFVGRSYSALGGFLAVACCIALARLLGGYRAAIYAGLLAMLSFPLVQHSHYATTSSLASGFLMLSAWASVLAYKQPSKYSYWLLAGIAAGLASGNRYNAAAISISLFVFGLFAIFQNLKLSVILPVLAGYIAFPFSFLLTTPFAVLDFRKFWQEFSYIYSGFKSEPSVLVSALPSWWLEWRYILVFGLGVSGGIALLIALWLFWKSWREKNFLLFVSFVSFLSFIIPYAFVVLNIQRPAIGDQLTVPIIPLLIVIVSLGLASLKSQALARILCVSSLIIPLILCFQWLSLLQLPDTREQLTEWVYTNIPRQSRILLLSGYNIVLDPADYQVNQIFSSPDTEFSKESYDFVIISDASLFSESRLTERNYDMLMAERLANLAAFQVIREIPRPRWLFDDWTVNNASYWHNPRLLLYCLNATMCTEIEN